jgi:hypothetical protein
MMAAAAVTTMLGLGFGIPTAEAAVPVTWCKGKSYQTLVKTYAYGSQKLALRCGSGSWGFLHISHRWNDYFDSMIALTIARGEKVSDLQQDGGSAIFSLQDNGCHELFRVIYNGGPYNGNGVSPQGIITAYETGTATTALPQVADGAEAASYRTDCPVYQKI